MRRRLGILVPTRNRPDIARRAVDHALSSGVPDVIVVSDNSTNPANRAALTEGWPAVDDPRVRVVAPPEPLPMTAHWEWAMQQLLAADPSLTHVTVLTDRMVYPPGALAAVWKVVGETPDKVVSWGHDAVDDYQPPIRLYQELWSGRRIVIPSGWLVHWTSKGRAMFSPIPRLLNCIAPVATVDAVRERYGTVFDSVAPDFCFAYKLLTVVPDFVYYDRSVMIQTHLDRSNGANVSRRGYSADARDFRANLRSELLSPLVPLPTIEALYNGVLNEYCFVRQVSGGALPPLELDGYLEHLAQEVAAKTDPAERAHDEHLLRDAGWTGTLERPASSWWERLHVDSSCVGSYRTGAVKGAARAVLGHRFTRPIWSALARTGVRPYPAQRFRFGSTDDALAYALRHPRPPWHDHPHITGLAGHPELEPAMP